MPTVYALLKQQNQDLSTANSFGELKIIFPLGIAFTDPGAISEAIHEALEDFDCDHDYILPVGSPVYIAIMIKVVCEIMYSDFKSHVKILEWRRGSYDVQTMEVEYRETA